MCYLIKTFMLDRLSLAQVQEPGAMDDTLPDELREKMEVLLAKRKSHRKSLH